MANHLFLGVYEHKLDAKGRVFLPRRLLEAVGDPEERGQFVLMRGLDRCLYLFTRRAFVDYLANVRRGAFGKPEYRGVMRGMGASSSEQSLDSQGRILIPEELRRKVGLADRVVVVGAIDHMEIWALEHWRESASAQAEETYLEHADSCLGTPDTAKEEP